MHDDDAFGIREGEIAVELPKDFDASVYFIGRIRTPWTSREQCPKNARESDAVCTLEQTDAGFRITSMRLSVNGEVEGIEEEAFRAAAQEAKAACPVSNALGDVEITMEASLSGST